MVRVSSKVKVRLSDDALRLEGCFSADALDMDPRRALNLVNDACARLGVEYALVRGELNLRALQLQPDEWAPILWATPPAPAVDGRIELLVPISVSAARGGIKGVRHAVKAGAALARKVPSLPREPAYDLLGRELPLRPSREAVMPQGKNTELRDDGTLLVAACDGEVRLTNMRIEILPMRVSEGDVAPGAIVSHNEEPLFIAGSVGEGARIEAGGDVHVAGNIISADVISGSSVTVGGSVQGNENRPCTIRAWECITVGDAQFANLVAGSDIRITRQVSDSVVETPGNLYLAGTLEESLQQVALRVQGAVFPKVVDVIASGTKPQIRRHFRVGCNLPGQVARHGTPPLTFAPCTVIDLGEGGARCRTVNLNTKGLTDQTVQLKFNLPSSHEPIITLARVAWSTDTGLRVTQSDIDWAPPPLEREPGLIGVAFLQLAQRHREMIQLYCQLAGNLAPAGRAFYGRTGGSR